MVQEILLLNKEYCKISISIKLMQNKAEYYLYFASFMNKQWFESLIIVKYVTEIEHYLTK